MNYDFPLIKDISDVLPFIEGRDEFIVSKKSSYTVINYAYQDENTFDNEDEKTRSILRECRGLIFDTSGSLIRRPFHKFFNVGEKEETQPNLHYDKILAKNILEKVDGSMVTPLILNDKSVRWATKMGITDTSMKAENWLANQPRFKEFARFFYSIGDTPIFEWIDKDNPIVVNHEESNMVLLAIRDTYNGNYRSYEELKDIAKQWDIDVVKQYHDEYSFLRDIQKNMEDAENCEGWVIRFDDGHMMKVKGDWYLNLHKIKDKLSSTRHIIEAIIEDRLDDLKGQIEDDKFLEKILNIEEEFWKRFQIIRASLLVCFNAHYALSDSRKEFAERVLGDDGINDKLKCILFKCYDNLENSSDTNVNSLQDHLKNVILKNLGSNTKFELFNDKCLKLEI